ncbi:MAG: methyltransferase [Porphyromonadaceae bacterium]|jgi:predicted O-methyltransferase YrrM|nr:methyltransferase [Porphyromonadaceae bacterium]
MTIEEYISLHSDDEPDYLAEINRETWVKQINPRMCSGHFQGRVLSMFSKMIQPKNILETGTFTGYSALSFAEGLAADGTLDTIEIDDELEDIILSNIRKSPFADKIFLHIGDALEIIPTLKKKYDLIFIDADKNYYIDYYEAVLPILNDGGYILVDNTLWGGKVVEKVDEHDKQTVEIIRFNDMIKADKRVEKVLLPVRDGLTLMRKLNI